MTRAKIEGGPPPPPSSVSICTLVPVKQVNMYLTRAELAEFERAPPSPCFTAALLLLYCCFTAALLLLY
jgi:hypothetical protein